MAGLFPKPKIQSVAPPPSPPVVDEAQLKVNEARRERQRRGRAATDMVGSETPVSTAARSLTGN